MKNQKTVLLCLALLLAAVLSFVRGGVKFSDPETYSEIVQSIDKKSADALRLTGALTVASAGVTLLPDDIATPVAEKLADFTQYFLVSLCVLFAEKYLLSLIGLAVFKLLVPAVCLLLIYRLFTKRGEVAGHLAARLLIFAAVLWLAIPVSIKASDLIYKTYEGSIQSTMEEAESLTQDISIFSNSNGTTFLERATDLMDRLLEALAVTIATSCVIPILVLLFFIWLAKILLGVTIPSPVREIVKRPDDRRKNKPPALPEQAEA